MRTIIIMRGAPELRRRAAAELLASLNPDINTVEGRLVSIDDRAPPGSKRDAVAAAANDCKNAVKKFLTGVGSESALILDNETPRRSDWQRFASLAKSLGGRTVGVQAVGSADAPPAELESEFASGVDLFYRAWPGWSPIQITRLISMA